MEQSRVRDPAGILSRSNAPKNTAAANNNTSSNIHDYNRVPGIQAIRTRDLVRTVRIFAASTSAHGFQRLNHPVTSCQVGWALLIIAAFTGLSVNLASLVIKYRDEPITTKIDPRGSRYVPPDITVCNRMMFAISKVFTSTQVFNSTTNETEYRYDIAPAFRPVFDSVQKMREVLELSVRRYLTLNYGSYEADTDLLRIEEESVYNLPNLVIQDTFGIRHLSQFTADPAQMLLSCTYGTRACDLRDFKPLALPAFPSCITFSAQRFSQRRPNLTVNSLNELSIGLFTDSYHDSPTVTSGLLRLPGDWFNMQSPGGAVVFVHKPGTYPTHGNSIEAPINQETVVDIRYLQYSSKSTRSYRCESGTRQLQYMVLDDQALKPISFIAQLADCHASVAQEILLSRCGFIDPTLPLSLEMADQPRRGNLSNLLLLRGDASSSSFNPADLVESVYQTFRQANTNVTVATLPAIIDALLDNEICLRRGRATANRDMAAQRCLGNCQAKVYTTSVVPIAWPVAGTKEFLRPLVQRWLQSNAYYSSNGSSSLDEPSTASVNEAVLRRSNWNLYQSYRSLVEGNSSLSAGSGELQRRNYLALKFRVADLQGRDLQTEESSAYELFDLFSDIGGILGLYVGISVLTLCEVAELCLQLSVMAGMLIHRRRTQTPELGRQQRLQQSAATTTFGWQVAPGLAMLARRAGSRGAAAAAGIIGGTFDLETEEDEVGMVAYAAERLRWPVTETSATQQAPPARVSRV